MAKILEGKSCAQKIEEQIKKEVQLLGIKPGLAAIIVGNNPASKIYVSRKIAACTECGFFTKTIELPDNCSEQKLLTVIQELNADEKIHGILLQLPLPKHLNEQHIIEKIDINKDVDGFHPLNRGLLVLGKPVYTACTPKGILELLNFYNITIAGKKCSHCRAKHNGRQTTCIASAERRCNSYHLPLKNKVACRAHKKSRYSCCCNRQSKHNYARHDNKKNNRD